VEDIFGDSENEEEFGGFEKDEVKPAVDHEEEEGKEADGDGVVERAEGDQGEDSSDDERPRQSTGHGDIVYDFDLMLQRKKEENYRRRKRKNIDIINDSDDVIAELIQQMKTAADEDFELNKSRQPATSKIRLLPNVEAPLRKIDLREAFLDAGILGVITDWLTPLPDRNLPNIKVRETMLSILHNFNITDTERLKSSGIGKAVMYLSKHPKESKENRAKAKSLISKWSRYIFSLDSDFHSISKEEREQRDFDHMKSNSKRMRSDSDDTPVKEKAGGSSDKSNLRPGEKGWVPRARVPMPSNRDYVHRPKSSAEVEMSRGSGKKTPSRFDVLQRSFMEKKRQSKAQRSVNISIEVRKM
jgi:transcription factor SPN1